MSVKITINFRQIEKEVNRNVADGINESLEILKKYALAESPIDTGEYNANHKISGANDNGKTISGTLFNNTYYAQILEYGVGGKIYGYHRYGRLYMAGVGARVYTRTLDNNLDTIRRIIEKHLSNK